MAGSTSIDSIRSACTASHRVSNLPRAPAEHQQRNRDGSRLPTRAEYLTVAPIRSKPDDGFEEPRKSRHLARSATDLRPKSIPNAVAESDNNGSHLTCDGSVAAYGVRSTIAHPG
jgi:hypothetical protein